MSKIFLQALNGMFEDKVGSILEEEAPLKGHQARRHYKNWLTPEIKKQMKIRDRMRSEAKMNDDREKWTKKPEKTKKLLLYRHVQKKLPRT